MSCQACATIPVVASDYTPKGAFLTINGLRTYVTGPNEAKTGLICVYDIFGLHSHTLQGADILAAIMPETLILVPDFFKGDPVGDDWIPADTDEKKQRLSTFMTTRADPAINLPIMLNAAAAAQDKYPAVTSWGTYGLCWGGKLTALASGANSPFKAAGTAHPGRLSVADVEAMTIPYVCLLSKEDGDEATVDAYIKALHKNSANYVEKYGDMHHGWMGARAKLDDKDNLAEYKRGYRKLADFFSQHLQ